MSPALEFSKLKIGAILNTASGSCDDTSEGRMRAIFEEAGIADVDMWCGKAEDMERAFAEAGAAKLDVLIVLGGDGTIRAAAQGGVAGGAFLIPLPGGTMNMLPKALYGNLGWEDALRATIARPRKRVISAGRIGSERFYIAAILGAPALWAKAREALREGELGAAFEKGKDALDTMFSAKIAYRFSDAASGTAEAISVICPLISTALADTEPVLEAAVIDVNDAGEVLGLATSAAFGAWREDKNVSVVTTTRVEVSAEQEIPLILDGESVSMGSRVEIEFVPDAFTVLVPSQV